MVKCTAQVSNLGRFRSTRGVVFRPTPRRDGYAYVRVNGKKYSVHRLQALAFALPRKEGQVTVNHKKEKINETVHLEWMTQAEQVRHSYATNKNRRSSAGKRSKPCRGRRVGETAWTEYASANEAARVLGLDPGNISACCAGKQKQTGGFEFEHSTPAEPEQLEGEEWRTVECTTASVSSLGRFRSTRGVVSTPSPDESGYVRVGVNGEKQYLHRLIAIAFNLPRKEGDDTVNHGDGDPGNNALWNLEWMTQAEQVLHSFATNKNRRSPAGKTSKPCRGRRVGETAWTEYASGNEAARVLGLDPGNISACCAGKRKQTGGFEFEHSTPTEPEQLEGEEWRDVVLE